MSVYRAAWIGRWRGSSRLSPVLSACSILAPRCLNKGFEVFYPHRATVINLGVKNVTLFSLLSLQLLADLSSRSSCFPSAVPGAVWASRQLARFSGDTSVSGESRASLWICAVSFADCMVCMVLWPLPASPILSFSAFLCVHGGHPVAACIYLVEPGVFWPFFFLGFASVVCLVLLFCPKVNVVYSHKLTVSMGGSLTCMKKLLSEVVCIVCIFILKNVWSAACPAEMAPLGRCCWCLDAFP